MDENKISSLEIEKVERDILFKFGWIFKNSLKEFSTAVDRSLGYLDKIVLPTIMASKQDKSYNPFSEIIEKFAIHILTHKLEKEGYKILPLGYSADLTLENETHILSIDVKTANIDNPSDFAGKINVGINQMTHVAQLRINRKILPGPFFVYPTIPPFYKFPNGKIKLILTYGLLFVYPSYSDLVREIREDYNSLHKFFIKKVRKVLVPIIARLSSVSFERAKEILKNKPEESKYSREELIAESIIRGVFIHELEKEKIIEGLNINSRDKEIIDSFSEKLRNFTNNLMERDVKPIAIVAVSLPNGLLKDFYLSDFVSGKNYSKSARYYYTERRKKRNIENKGIFKIIKEKTGEEFPRVLFLDINKDYIDDLKKHFGDIIVLDYKLKRL